MFQNGSAYRSPGSIHDGADIAMEPTGRNAGKYKSHNFESLRHSLTHLRLQETTAALRQSHGSVSLSQRTIASELTDRTIWSGLVTRSRRSRCACHSRSTATKLASLCAATHTTLASRVIETYVIHRPSGEPLSRLSQKT